MVVQIIRHMDKKDVVYECQTPSYQSAMDAVLMWGHDNRCRMTGYVRGIMGKGYTILDFGDYKYFGVIYYDSSDYDFWLHKHRNNCVHD